MARTLTTTALPALLYPRDLSARLPGQLFRQRIQRSHAPLRQRAMILETLKVVLKACGLVISPNVPCHTEFDIEPIILRRQSEVQLRNWKHCLNMALGMSKYAGYPVILEFMSWKGAFGSMWSFGMYNLQNPEAKWIANSIWRRRHPSIRVKSIKLNQNTFECFHMFVYQSRGAYYDVIKINRLDILLSSTWSNHPYGYFMNMAVWEFQNEEDPTTRLYSRLQGMPNACLLETRTPAKNYRFTLRFIFGVGPMLTDQLRS